MRYGSSWALPTGSIILLTLVLLSWNRPCSGDSIMAPRSRYLVLDSRVVAQSHNVQLVPGTVSKHTANPLFKEEYPWEHRFDNLYPNVIFDSQEGIYKCWYNHFITYTPSKKAKWKLDKPYPPGTPKHLMAVSYAYSRDGIQWHKPMMDIVPFKGRRSNMVAMGRHGVGVFKDLHESDPKKRYKMFFRLRKNEPSVSFSPDGLHWTEPIICREIHAKADTHNNALWAPALDRYVGFTRLFTDQRIVGRTESPDFLHWSKAVEVLRGSRAHQSYAMPVFRYADLYLGLLMVFHTAEDRVDCQLAWSPDTVHWQRIAPGRPLIPNSQRQGDYDWGCVYAAAYPLVMKDKIRLYYGASDGTHYGKRRGYLALATLRPDGFAGYRSVPGQTIGELVTRPVRIAGSTLQLTADAAGGEIRVSLLDDSGRLLSESEVLSGNVTDATVRWRRAVTFGKLQGRAVQLRFTIKHATLYSFRFAD